MLAKEERAEALALKPLLGLPSTLSARQHQALLERSDPVLVPWACLRQKLEAQTTRLEGSEDAQALSDLVTT